MYKTFKYRIEPNAKQRELIEKTFNCSRFIWNYFLNMRLQEYKMENNIVDYNECNRQLVQLKKDPEYAWLKEVDGYALQSEIRYLEESFLLVSKLGFNCPKFKSKKNSSKSYSTWFSNGNIKVLNEINKIRLPKLGNIKARISRPTEGHIVRAIVSLSNVGKYYVSIVCKIDNVITKPKTYKKVGIDLGVSNYITLSTGETIQNPSMFQEYKKRISKAQRKLDRKPRSSKRREKEKRSVAKRYEKLTNARKDFRHKVSHTLISGYDFIGIETLDVNKMLISHTGNLAGKISDCGWSTFKTYLKYKALLYDKDVVEVNMYYPSSQLCSCCGQKNILMKDLHNRIFHCNVCGLTLDRDVNAAINILNEAERSCA